MEKKTVIIFIGIFIVIGFILVWSNNKDREREEWAELYEGCVMKEYRTTPWEYYYLNGEYPKCNYKTEIQKIK